MKSGLIDLQRLDRARDQFAVAFYRWAQADAEKQAAQDFPLFALLRDSLAEKYLRVYHALPENDKRTFLRAMLRRTHERAVQLTGEYLTDAEQRLIDAYKQTPWDENRKEMEARWSRPRLTADDRKQLGKLVRERIEKEAAGEFEEWTPSDLVFHRIVGSWKVSTIVAIKSKQNLGYDHSISVATDPEIRLKERISITGWLGLSETNWDYMTPNELNECAESVMVLAKYFLDAVPALLASVTL